MMPRLDETLLGPSAADLVVVSNRHDVCEGAPARHPVQDTEECGGPQLHIPLSATQGKDPGVNSAFTRSTAEAFVSWGESSVIVFANSVLARSGRYPGR